MPAPISLPVSATLQQQWLAAAQKSGVIGEVHLFLEVLEDESDETVAALLALSGVSREEARLYAQSWLGAGLARSSNLSTEETAERLEEGASPVYLAKIELARSASQALKLADGIARLDQSPFIESHHLFIACVSHRKGPHLGEVLRPLGLDVAQLRGHLRGLKRVERPYSAGNPLNDLTEGAKRAIEAAHAEMRASFCGRIATAHLLLGLLSDEETAATLENAGCDLELLRKRARDSIKSDGEIAMPQKRFSPGAKRALERAARAAETSGHKFINCGDLLLGLLPGRETVGEKWRARGRKVDSVDFLWTEAQAEALRNALNFPIDEDDEHEIADIHRDFRLTASSPELARFQEVGIVSFVASFVMGFAWVSYNSFIPLLLGLGFLWFVISRSYNYAEKAWLVALPGGFLGAAAAMYLLQML